MHLWFAPYSGRQYYLQIYYFYNVLIESFHSGSHIFIWHFMNNVALPSEYIQWSMRNMLVKMLESGLDTPIANAHKGGGGTFFFFFSSSFFLGGGVPTGLQPTAFAMLAGCATKWDQDRLSVRLYHPNYPRLAYSGSVRKKSPYSFTKKLPCTLKLWVLYLRNNAIFLFWICTS